ncbi:MAG TPA: hypothetical protein IAA98_11425 [Candidatus Avipropionibacterium avicola]|uniref:Uncharacterized protein n=1 Tax=Candidatus Avipropionibacterium avicola TaxID=2840701 RepID=A0A9D1KPB1_9ACTN|nr:hypothetical protein [Candidatus Avipropionibacterium avicola]
MTIAIPAARPIAASLADPLRARRQPTLFDADTTTNATSPGQRPTRSDAAAHTRVRQFAVVTLEVLAGLRPPNQLTRWTTESVQSVVSLAARRGGVPRLHLASVHCQRPHPRVIEASLRVVVARRSIAMACQLRLVKGRWVCTAWEYRPADLQAATRAEGSNQL